MNKLYKYQYFTLKRKIIYKPYTCHRHKLISFKKLLAVKLAKCFF